MKGISLAIAIFGLVIISTAQNNESESSYWSGDKIMKGGFFMDGNLGYMSLSQKRTETYYDYYSGAAATIQKYSYKREGPGLGINVGGKFYFGQSESHRYGVSVSGGFDVYMDEFDFFDPTFVLSPLNLGFTNIWKIDETHAFEANLNFGPKIYTAFGLRAFGINPEVRFRLKKLTLGLGYSMGLPISNPPNSVTTAHRVNFIIGIR